MIVLMTSPRLLHQSENVLQQTTLSMKREGVIKITHFTLYKYQRNMWVNHIYICIYIYIYIRVKPKTVGPKCT